MLLHTVNQKHVVEFDRGRFDDWCVYLKREGQTRYAPSDVAYFSFFKNLDDKYGPGKVYADFVRIYEATTAQPSDAALALVKRLASAYATDAEEAEVWFSVIYGGMIAEENKKKAILKKRIKRLGMHQVLIEHYEPSAAARFSFGKPWRILDEWMRQRGF